MGTIIINPAECFPVSEYLRDELEARGWSVRDAAARMNGDAAQNELWLEIVCCGATWERGDVKFTTRDAIALEALTGIAAETWANLHNAYVRWRKFAGN